MAKILIINNHSDTQKLLDKELRLEGHEVCAIADVESIWAEIEKFRPDIVLLDLYLYGLKTWNVFREIKRRSPCLPVHICVIKDSGAIDTIKAAIGEVLENRLECNLQSSDEAFHNQSLEFSEFPQYQDLH